MRNISHLRITVLTLISILVFSVSPASADKNKLKTVSGVIETFPNLYIPFPPYPKFFAFNDEIGRYIITIDKRWRCTFREGPLGEEQAAQGVRLATPSDDTRVESVGSNYYLSSPLFFVDSVETGYCNDVAVYQFTARNRSDDSLVNGPFSFQITGSKTKKKYDDDEMSDDDEMN